MSRDLLQVRTIYAEPVALELPRGQQVVSRWPGAEVVEVASALRIPQVHGADSSIDRWVRSKTEVLALGVRKSLTARKNEWSANWIAPSIANGCAMACGYCYVPRHKGYADPITVYANIDDVVGYLQRHVVRQGVKPAPDQCDPLAWVYDIGENSDRQRRCPGVGQRAGPGHRGRGHAECQGQLRDQARQPGPAGLRPPGTNARIRFSVMPEPMAKLVDIRTDPVADRIAAVDDFVDAGYEVHLNLSPVIVHEGWLQDWAQLLDQLNAGLSDRAKAQCAAEVIFLTHNEGLHQMNVGWHPRGEEVLWQPAVQEAKTSHNGMTNVRYRARWKAVWVRRLLDLMSERTPWLTVRYAF